MGGLDQQMSKIHIDDALFPLTGCLFEYLFLGFAAMEADMASCMG